MTRRGIARLAAAGVAVVCTLGLLVPLGGPELSATGVTGGSQSVMPK